MKTIGTEIIADVWGCDFDEINNDIFLEGLLVRAALKAGMEVRETCFSEFSPQGVSGTVIISESSLGCHSYPESGFLALNIYTCGELDPLDALKEILKYLTFTQIDILKIERGDEHGISVHRVSYSGLRDSWNT